ncbi:MAG: isochorismatase family protein [Comamonas sp.]
MTLASRPNPNPPAEAHGTHLLVIDAQNDFCDIAGAALPVPGADADLRRLAALIRANLAAIDAITLTLDSHYRIDIAHPGFWRSPAGAVTPFTAITARQVREGAYGPRRAGDLPRVLAYLDALEAGGRYTHTVWPVHCEIGTWGHNLHAELAAACAEWEDFHGRQALRVFKGMNPWTEHYSAVRAEVPIDDDPHTQTHAALLARLGASGRLLVAGEAGSHCVKATVEDVAEAVDARRIVLLADAMSPVAGFERQQRDFLQALQARGAALRTTAEAFAPSA